MIFNNEFHLFSRSIKFGYKFSDLEGEFIVKVYDIWYKGNYKYRETVLFLIQNFIVITNMSFR